MTDTNEGVAPTPPSDDINSLRDAFPKEDYERMQSGRFYWRPLGEVARDDIEDYTPWSRRRPSEQQRILREFVDRAKGELVFAEDARTTDLVTSLCRDGRHRPAIDIDFPVRLLDDPEGGSILVWDAAETQAFQTAEKGYGVAKAWYTNGHPQDTSANIRTFVLPFKATLVPSSTEGHFHLYGDNAPMIWHDYWQLLLRMMQAKLIEENYYTFSAARGFTALRQPGQKRKHARTPSAHARQRPDSDFLF